MAKGTERKCFDCEHCGRDSTTCNQKGTCMMSISHRRSKRSGDCSGEPKTKRGKQEKQGSNWSDLPRDVVECIHERLLWTDRIRIRLVCKAWSVPNLFFNTPVIDKVPWALRKFSWYKIDNGRIQVECRVLDLLSREYVTERSVRGKECGVFLEANFLCSAYGWVLFEKPVWSKSKTGMPIFLYSPFTTEVINLQNLGDRRRYQAVALSLNATSPRCDIFHLGLSRDNCSVDIMLYTVGDGSPKTFKFNSGVRSDMDNHAVSAVYGNGVFYCLFDQGELGAFDVEHEEWRILTNGRPSNFSPVPSQLIAFGASLWGWRFNRHDKHFKFDFSKRSWVCETELNNHVLFIGRGSSFAVPAVGEISLLANAVVSCHSRRFVLCYGDRVTESLLYRNCIEASGNAIGWIEPPSGRIWRANDLTKAFQLNVLQCSGE